ncbi:MAG: hypothetical protein AAB552_02575 [Patescibacteria group bacterium]
MVWKFKKIILLSLAIIFGLGIIFLAVAKNYSSKDGSADTATESSDDSWKDALTIAPQTSSDLLIAGKQASIKGTSTAITLPPTTTETLAQNLLLEYIVTEKAKGGAVMSDTDAQAAALRLVEKTKTPLGKQYQPKDLIISVDNSSAAMTAYATKIKTVMLAFTASATKSDIEVVYMSPADTKRKAEYTRTIARYEKLVKGLLATKTPSNIAPLHLRLVQAYSNMEHSVTAMMSMFADPIKGLAALTEYRTEISNLTALAKEYDQYLAKIQ